MKLSLTPCSQAHRSRTALANSGALSHTISAGKDYSVPSRVSSSTTPFSYDGQVNPNGGGLACKIIGQRPPPGPTFRRRDDVTLLHQVTSVKLNLSFQRGTAIHLLLQHTGVVGDSRCIRVRSPTLGFHSPKGMKGELPSVYQQVWEASDARKGLPRGGHACYS